MSFQIKDFKNILQLQNQRKLLRNKNVFSLIIDNDRSEMRYANKYSICNAIKPFIFFITIFGTRLFGYSNNGIKKVSKLFKLHNLFIIALFIILIVVLKPTSWSYTKSDVPLNILTILFGFLHNIEAIYLIVAVKFCNDSNYVNLFLYLEDIDIHLGFISKKVYYYIRSFAIILVVVPIVQYMSSFYLRKFNINNIGVQTSFFLLMIQGATIELIMLNLYVRIYIFNIFMEKKRVKRDNSQHTDNYFKTKVLQFIVHIHTRSLKQLLVID